MTRKIGIVSYGYGWVPCEPGPNRFYYIAKAFSDAGWDTELIGPSFQHFEKKYRDRAKIAAQNYPFKVGYIENTPYKKNIDLRRIRSNAIAAKRVHETLEGKDFDLIYCSIPANNVAAAVCDFARAHNIPIILDVEDLWPEAMQMVIKNRPLQKLIFPYFTKDAEKAYSICDAVIGTSEDYTARATKNNGRDIPMKTVYVGVDMQVFDSGVKKYTDSGDGKNSIVSGQENQESNGLSDSADKKTDIIKKPENELWVSYAGSLGQSYDIDSLVRAAKKLTEKAYDNVKIKLLGTGPNMDSLQALSKELGVNNVEFLGYTDYPKMAAYLNQSDIVVNSFIKGAPQSIPNKIGDYLASGSAVINTLENPVAKALIDNNDCGINVIPEDPEALFLAIERLINDPAMCTRQGHNARALAEKRFDRSVSYREIVELAELFVR